MQTAAPPRAVRLVRWAVVVVVSAGILPLPLWAQCLEHRDVLESNSCASEPPPPPSNAKAMETVVIGWGSGSFLFVSDGNEILLFNVTNAEANPIQILGSDFNVGNLGDSDYDLLSFEVCDDCRFGIANYKLGTVIFDLGSDPARPRFGAYRLFPEADDVKGGMVFRHGDREYVLANDLSDLCGGASLLEVTNPGTIQLEHRGCLAVPGVFTQVLGGFKVDASHLYVGDRSGEVYIVEIAEADGNHQLQYVDSAPFRANQQRGKGFDVDPSRGLVVCGSPDMWLEVYDIRGAFAPGASIVAPVRVARLGPPSSPFNVRRRVAIQFPLVYGAYLGTNLPPEIYDVSSPQSPSGPLDPTFWDPANSWNDWDCRKEYDGAFHPSAGVLYLARYQVAQAVDTSACFRPPGLFEDGFEAGTTGAWSETFP